MNTIHQHPANLPAGVATGEHVRRLYKYDPDTGQFTWRVRRGPMEPGDVAGTNHGQGYIALRVSGRLYFAHRVAWLWMTGEWPSLFIDHIDRNPSNNAWRNLRQVTNGLNNLNGDLTRLSKSGMPRGVWRDKNRFVAAIQMDGVRRRLGRFLSVDEAAKAYRLAHSRIDFDAGAAT